jgi:hypothetical protein
VMFPFSIRSETMEKSGGVIVTPMNGRTFSCRSHFHPTTSLTRSLGSGVSDSSNSFGIKPLTLCSFSGFAVVPTLRVFIATRRLSRVAP